MHRSVLALTLVLLTSVTVDARAQRKGPASGAPGAPLTVSARIDDKNYGATGPGRCKHAPTVSLSTSSTTHRINSVGKPQSENAATVKVSPLATGGRFELKGNDAGGAKIDLTVACPIFAGVEAEGG